MRLTTLVSLFVVGSAVWAAVAASVGCESCGSECASACGTRHFRACCFNYLRRKREQMPNVKPAGLKLQLWLARNQQDPRQEHRLPLLLDMPEAVQLPYGDDGDDPIDSRLQFTYDA